MSRRKLPESPEPFVSTESREYYRISKEAQRSDGTEKWSVARLYDDGTEPTPARCSLVVDFAGTDAAQEAISYMNEMCSRWPAKR